MAPDPRDPARLAEQIRLLEYSHDAIIGMSADRVITSWNAGARETYGYSAEEALGTVIHSLLRTKGPVSVAEIDEMLARNGRWDGELTHERSDGGQVIVESRQVAVPGGSAGVAILEINRDITARKRSEAALLEAQKLESIGLLAGGVAHQFNNLLTGVLGNASLALDAYPDHPARALIEEVVRSTEAAAHLTRQLLAYAGKARYYLERLDPNKLVQDVVALAKGSLPKRARVSVRPAADAPKIEADPSQAKQLILNLLFNAAEALPPAGGQVVVSTSLAVLEAGNLPTATRGEAAPGRYLLLAVEDNGLGIDPAVEAQLFAPFFSTKFLGRGLGLPAVLGIVRSHNGFLTLRSAPGCGTTFQVFIPAAR